MIRLLYISTARHAFSPEELDGVLRISRRNNRAAGVTGLLVAGGRRFLQVLEGEPANVLATYERIRQDPRQFAVVELARETIAHRSFATWAMGAQAGGAAGAEGSATDAVAALIAPIADPRLRGYFTGFAQTQAAA